MGATGKEIPRISLEEAGYSTDSKLEAHALVTHTAIAINANSNHKNS